MSTGDAHTQTPLFASFLQGIASLGGTFLDCNKLFCELSQQTKDQVQKLSIFNLTSKEQLPYAFDRLSCLLAPDTTTSSSDPIVLQGSMSHVGLQIRLLDRGQSFGKDETSPSDCRSKLLLVTLVQQTPSDSTIVSSSSPILSTSQEMSIGSTMEKPVHAGSIPFYYSVA